MPVESRVRRPKAHDQPRTAGGDAGGIGLPALFARRAYRFKYPFGKELKQRPSAHPLAHLAQHLRAGGIIVEQRARLVIGLCGKEAVRPAIVDSLAVGRPLIAGRHAQHIADRQAQEALVRLFRQLIREIIDDMIVKAQFSFVRQNADRQRHHRLADGIHAVRLALFERRIVPLCAHLAVFAQFKAVQAYIFPFQPVNEG